ncbi:MAG: DUF2939 domain-containing protein [Pseudomonadota bacterium]
MKRIGIIVAALLVVAAAGWWFASPWLALKGMRDAAVARDARSFSAYVDYQSVRADLVEQVRDKGANGIGSRVAAALVARAAVSPAGIRAMFALPEGEGGGIRAENLAMHRDGLNQFRMVPKDGRGPTLQFGRFGLGWKLTAVRFPS